MYLDTNTLLAIMIALVGQLIMMVVLFRSAYKWEQHYRDVVRLLKHERHQRIQEWRDLKLEKELGVREV